MHQYFPSSWVFISGTPFTNVIVSPHTSNILTNVFLGGKAIIKFPSVHTRYKVLEVNVHLVAVSLEAL